MSLPALWPAVALLAGAGAGLTATAAAPASVLWCVPLLLATAGAAASAAADRPRACSALVAGGCALSGWLLVGVAQEDARRSSLRAFYDAAAAGMAAVQPVVVEGVLARDAVLTPYGASLAVATERVWHGGTEVPVTGGVRLSVGGSLAGERVGDWRAGRRIRAPAALRRPSTYRNPGARDEEAELNRRGIVLLGSVKSAMLVEIVAPAPPLHEAAAEARAVVRRALEAHVTPYDSQSAAIVTAILIGDRGGLTDETRQRLQAAGTYHVIAISGAHIAILTGLILVALRFGRVSWRPAAAATIVLLVAYAFVVGEATSVRRATLMAVACLAACLLDQRTPPLNALALAAAIIVAATPLAVIDAGFLLSFGATVGILLGAGPMASAIVVRVPVKRWVAPAATLLAATVAAELALLPMGAWFFSRVTLAGLVLNYAAIPLMGVVQAAGMATTALALVVPALASWTGWLAHAAVTGILDSSRLLDLAPWLSRRVPAPPAFVLCAYYGGWCLWLALPRSAAAARRCAAGLMAAAAVLVVAAPAGVSGVNAAGILRSSCLPPQPDGDLHVTMLDVGQSDATLVRLPDGRFMLVDAGGTPTGTFDVGSRIVTPALWALGVRRLDVLVLTHGHPDHIGGASSIVRNFRPREVWDGVQVPSHAPMEAVRVEARRVGAAWRYVRAGAREVFGGAEVRVLHPPKPDWERPHVRNDDSVVLEIRFGAVSVVLPGDIEEEGERAVLGLGSLGFDGLRVVKAPHHGSASSSSAPFVEATRPAVVLFSAGAASQFGHPAPAVVDRYRAAGAAMFRTDADGAVAVTTDGARISVATCA